jgi:hypothetical protein
VWNIWSWVMHTMSTQFWHKNQVWHLNVLPTLVQASKTYIEVQRTQKMQELLIFSFSLCGSFIFALAFYFSFFESVAESKYNSLFSVRLSSFWIELLTLAITTPLLCWLSIHVIGIALVKKACPYKCNQEHKQERRRCNPNCGWMFKLTSWGLTNHKDSETFSNRLI